MRQRVMVAMASFLKPDIILIESLPTIGDAHLRKNVRTIQDWEQGRSKPSGPAETLLRIAEQKPEVSLDLSEAAGCVLQPRPGQLSGAALSQMTLGRSQFLFFSIGL
jgi:hypothetical protein